MPPGTKTVTTPRSIPARLATGASRHPHSSAPYFAAVWGNGTTEYALDALLAASRHEHFASPIEPDVRLPMVFVDDLMVGLLSLQVLGPALSRRCAASQQPQRRRAFTVAASMHTRTRPRWQSRGSHPQETAACSQFAREHELHEPQRIYNMPGLSFTPAELFHEIRQVGRRPRARPAPREQLVAARVRVRGLWDRGGGRATRRVRAHPRARPHRPSQPSHAFPPARQHLPDFETSLSLNENMSKFAKLWPDTLSTAASARDLDYQPEVTLPRMVASVLNAHSSRRVSSKVRPPALMPLCAPAWPPSMFAQQGISPDPSTLLAGPVGPSPVGPRAETT